VGWAGRVDVVASSVDGDVVVPPAEGGEVFEVVGSALTAGDDVVDFEPISGSASVDGAALVPVENKTAEFGGYDPGGWPDGEGSPGLGVDDDFDGSFAEYAVEGVWSDAGSGGEGDSGFAVGLGGLLGVDHDRHDRTGRPARLEAAVEPVLGDGDESVGAKLVAGPTPCWGGELVGSLVEGLVDDVPVVGAELSVYEPHGLIERRSGANVAFLVGLSFVAASDSPSQSAHLVDTTDVSLGGFGHGGLVGSFPVEAGEGGGPVEGPVPGCQVGHAF
jgi:hypothetical protein